MLQLPWGSQSIKRVFLADAARPAARFRAVVVFPTPPFWFATAIITESPSLHFVFAKVFRVNAVKPFLEFGFALLRRFSGFKCTIS